MLVTSSDNGTSTTTYTTPDNGSVWMIDQLKNKEMIVKGKTSMTSGSSTSTTEYSYTFEQD